MFLWSPCCAQLRLSRCQADRNAFREDQSGSSAEVNSLRSTVPEAPQAPLINQVQRVPALDGARDVDGIVCAPTSPDRYSFDIEMNADGDVTKDDASVLIVACFIGLSTGLGVVMFQSSVHYLQERMAISAAASLPAFAQSNVASWKMLLLPPVVAGLAVSALRDVAGGFDGDPRALALGCPSSTTLPERNSLIPTVQGASQPPTVASLQQALNRSARQRAAKAQYLSPTATWPRQEGYNNGGAAMPPYPSPSALSGGRRSGQLVTSAPISSVLVNSGTDSLDTVSTPAAQYAVPEGPCSPVRYSEARMLQVRLFLRPYLKLLAAAVTLGSGASLGPEGPSADLGKANAERLGTAVPPGVCFCSASHLCAFWEKALLSGTYSSVREKSPL